MNSPSATTPRWSTGTMRRAAESGDLATPAARLAEAGIPPPPAVAVRSSTPPLPRPSEAKRFLKVVAPDCTYHQP